MHIDQKITYLIDNEDTYREMITRYPVYDEKVIAKDLYLITHAAEISKAICDQHGIDYIDVLNNTKGNSVIQEELKNIQNVSVGISASITSYSSIFMLKLKQEILSSGGEIYYTDTDSIVTNILLPENLIAPLLCAPAHSQEE